MNSRDRASPDEAASDSGAILKSIRQAAAGEAGGASDHSRLTDFLKKNKISFLWLKNLDGFPDWAEYLSSESFQSEYRAESARRDSWLKDFRDIRTEWDKAKIEHIFIKSTGSFPHLSDNVDVLVRPGDFGTAGKILGQMGYLSLRNIQEPHKEFYRRFQSGNDAIPIHLHERVCWGVPYDNSEHLWKSRIASKDDDLVHYPSPEDALLINVAHCFLEDHLIKIHDLLVVRKCLAGEIDWEYVLKTAENMHWLHAFYSAAVIMNWLHQKIFETALFPAGIIELAQQAIQQKRWIRRRLRKTLRQGRPLLPFPIPHLWTRIHSSLRVVNDPAFGSGIERWRIVFLQLLDGFIHLKLNLRFHPRMFVAVGGIDGSGKTSHCRALQAAFQLCEIPTVYVWSRAGSLPLTNLFWKSLRSFFFKRKGTEKGPLDSTEYKFSRSSFNVEIWRTLNVIELISFYFMKIFIPVLLGRAVIADRYIYDAMVDIEHLRSPSTFGRMRYRILRLLTPKPDIYFILSADLAKLIHRVSDELPDILAQKYPLYREISAGASTMLLDSSRDFAEVSGRISRTALEHFFAKYPQKYDCYQPISLRYK